MLGNLRLVSGFVLFIFILGHFINHGLGIVSLNYMNNATYYTIDLWRTSIGTAILLSAIAVHITLAVYALYQKRTYRMPSWQAFQLVTGFLIPVLIAAHVLDARGAYEFYELNEGYSVKFYSMWIAYPWRGVMLIVCLLIAWLHACIGWHFWLRLKPWYQRWKVWFFSFALIVPVFALCGILSASLRVSRLARSEKWVDKKLAKVRGHGEAYVDFVYGYEKVVILCVLAIIVAVFLLQIARRIREKLQTTGQISYRTANLSRVRKLDIVSGQSILEMLRYARIDHASVCGGRGRCSTCRVRIDEGLDNLPPASFNELKVLARVSTAPNMRLACQVRPESSLSVTALLTPDVGVDAGFARSKSHEGDEQHIAVLFADIRAFTRLSEDRLPFDIAFLLNRYFATMGKAIEEEGGHLDKFIGDGVMALFGIDQDQETACRNAVAAAKAMAEALKELNASLESELQEPLRIGIGIHTGPAIVGTMGYKEASSLTAIGDTVNTASRLESMTKELGAQLVVSKQTADLAGKDFSTFDLVEVEIRGREETMPVYAVPDATELQTDLPFV